MKLLTFDKGGPDEKEIVIFTKGRVGYVAVIDIETNLPPEVQTEDEIIDYLLEDFEDAPR